MAFRKRYIHNNHPIIHRFVRKVQRNAINHPLVLQKLILDPSEFVPFKLPIIPEFVDTLEEDRAEFTLCSSGY